MNQTRLVVFVRFLQHPPTSIRIYIPHFLLVKVSVDSRNRISINHKTFEFFQVSFVLTFKYMRRWAGPLFKAYKCAWIVWKYLNDYVMVRKVFLFLHPLFRDVSNHEIKTKGSNPKTINRWSELSKLKFLILILILWRNENDIITSLIYLTVLGVSLSFSQKKTRENDVIGTKRMSHGRRRTTHHVLLHITSKRH